MLLPDAPARSQALARLKVALASCRVQGIATNLELHRALLSQSEFARGGVDTSYLPRNLGNLLPATAA